MSIEIIQTKAIIEETFGNSCTQLNPLLEQLREALRVENEARVAVERAGDALEAAQIKARAAYRDRENIEEKVAEETRGFRPLGQREYVFEQDEHPRSRHSRSRMYAPRRRDSMGASKDSDAYKGFKKLFAEARQDEATVYLRAKLDPQGPSDMLAALTRLEIPGNVGTLALMKYRGEEVIVIIGSRSLGNVVIYTVDGVVTVHGENGYSVLKNDNVSSEYVLKSTIEYVRERA